MDKHNDVELSVYDSVRISGDGVAGRAMDIAENGVCVQSVCGHILIKRVKPAGGAKIGATEWANECGIKPGDQLGS